MHYYSFNISDFNNSTRHLTRLERSIYRDLIDMYYDTEQPISSDIKLVSRKIIANLPEEIEAIQQILNEFFTSTDDGYTKKRIDKEIDIYHSKADIARANGKLGGRPKKSDNNPDKPSGLIIGTDKEPKPNPEESGSKANQELITNNNKPVTNKIPYQLIADAYQKYYSDPTGNGGLVAVKQWSAKRKGAIKKLWLLDTDNELENNQTNNIEHWERYFDYCSSIAFFQGDASRNDDHANWKASFDFLIKIDTYNANKERKYS